MSYWVRFRFNVHYKGTNYAWSTFYHRYYCRERLISSPRLLHMRVRSFGFEDPSLSIAAFTLVRISKNFLVALEFVLCIMSVILNKVFSTQDCIITVRAF